MSEIHYYLSSCSPHSETAAANPMKPYSKEDCAEIIAHEGGTAYVLASDYERELAAKSAEVKRLREALRNLLVMLPSVACDGEDKERIPGGFCYVRWQDIREAHEALEAK